MSTSISLEFTRLVNSHRLSLKRKGGERKCSYMMKRNLLQICYETFSDPKKLAKRSIITGSKKLKNSVITMRCHCCRELQWILRDMGIPWQNKKENIIKSLLYKKLLISNPFVISFLYVCFYAQYPIFCPFLAG